MRLEMVRRPEANGDAESFVGVLNTRLFETADDVHAVK
jgi:hypothetical protein